MLKELSLQADNTWLGATDDGHEGLWINVDGSDYEQEWLVTDQIQEPDNGAAGNGEQNCMTMINSIMPSGPFGDVDAKYAPVDLACDSTETNGFICEKPGEKFMIHSNEDLFGFF